MKYIFRTIIFLVSIFISWAYTGYAKGENHQSSVEILFFYSPGCHHCLKVKNEILPQLLKKTNKAVKVKFLDIGKISNYQLLLTLERRFPVIGKGDMPKIFVGNIILAGGKAVKEKLVEKIDGFSGKLKLLPFSKPPPKLGSLLLQRFRSFNFLVITTAGFLDGLNPCAFAVIVFFISFLSLMKYKRKEVFFFNDTATTEIYTLSLHDALPISALGHQINITISDLVAHTALKTPTKSAQFLVEMVKQAIDKLIDINERILAQANFFIDESSHNLESRVYRMESLVNKYFVVQREDLVKKQSLIINNSCNFIHSESEKVLDSMKRLKFSFKSAILSLTDNLTFIENKVNLLNPVRILCRGYSISYKDNKLIKSSSELKPGDSLRTIFAKGEALSRVRKTII